MKHVVVIENGVAPEKWERKDVEDLGAFIIERFPQFPETARIYHNAVCVGNDVTPQAGTIEQDTDFLEKLEGVIYIVVYPAGALAVPLLIGLAIGVAAYVLAPQPPSIPTIPAVMNRNSQASSPNNDLSDRANRPRINGRIPDIFGEVRATPDLIAGAYRIYENNREVEYAYMCIGRGDYEVEDVKDGETRVEDIPGTSVDIYGPYRSPNSYDPTNPTANQPFLTIGETNYGITPVLNTKRSNSVNGQVLRPANVATFLGNARAVTPNRIEIENFDGQDFAQYFVEGDEIVISGMNMTDAGPVPIPVQLRACTVDLVHNYPGGSHTYNTTNALIFAPELADILAEVFPDGATVHIETNSVTSVGDLTGDYLVTFSGLQGPSDIAEAQAGVPSYYVVKVFNPSSVNANWDNVNPANYFQGLTPFNSEVQYDDTYNLDLDGTYTVISVSQLALTLDNPSAVSADWTGVLPSHGGTSPFFNVSIVSSGEKWVGPFILEDVNLTDVFCNFIAQNGLYKDDGTDQVAASVGVQVEITPVDLADEPLADPELFELTLTGSAFVKETVASTMKAKPSSFFGRCAIRARRTTESDTAFEGQVIDEVRWKDAYSVSPVNKTNFGNVTTVFAVTFATASALAVKERKLNMIVRRKIPTWTGSAIDTETLAYSSDVPLVLAAICRDKYLGNRLNAELDVAGWFTQAEAAETYFGTDVVREFNYTFDKDNTSFEEMVNAVAQVMFCIAYRRGNVIKLSLEKATPNSVLLFNHRNKIPDSEKRAINFGGFTGDFDGVEFTYVDPADDSLNTIFLPPDTACINPKKIESVGIRDHLQGYFHAWRAWNKIRFQTDSVEFDATQEADLLIRNDRILVSDGTRATKQEGEVIAIDGLELTLSQEVQLTASPPYSIYLQHYDETVEIIGVTAGTNPNQVVLDDAPLLDLSVDSRNYARSAFVIVGNSDPAQMAFLVTEKTPGDNVMTCSVKAINYHAGYYANDTDFIDEVIGENGYGQTGGFTPTAGGDAGYNDGGAGGGPELPDFSLGTIVMVAEQDGTVTGVEESQGQGTVVSNTAWTGEVRLTQDATSSFRIRFYSPTEDGIETVITQASFQYFYIEEIGYILGTGASVFDYDNTFVEGPYYCFATWIWFIGGGDPPGLVDGNTYTCHFLNDYPTLPGFNITAADNGSDLIGGSTNSDYGASFGTISGDVNGNDILSIIFENIGPPCLFEFAVEGTLDQRVFTELHFTDRNSTPITLASEDAGFSTAGGKSTWTWVIDDFPFDAASNYSFTFTI